jgi:hypothetical protein
VTVASLAVGHALALAALSATAWAAGRLTLRLLRVQAVPASLTLAAGLMTLAQVSLALGLVGALRVPMLAAFAVAVWALAGWDRLVWDRPHDGPPSWLASAGVGSIVLLVALPGAVLTMYPPLGFDQTLYHLPTSRAFAATGGVPFLPALRYPIFPPLGDVLNASVLLVAGDAATQLTGWLALAVGLGLVYVWARERSSRAGGALAAGVLAGSPIAWYLASTGYVEPLLALFGLAPATLPTGRGVSLERVG